MNVHQVNRNLQAKVGAPIDMVPPPPQKSETECPHCETRFSLPHPVDAALSVWCASCWHDPEFDRDAAVASVIPRERDLLAQREDQNEELRARATRGFAL